MITFKINGITFDPYLSHTLGFSYHSLIYLTSALLYFLFGWIWFFHAKRHRKISRGVPLFSALSILLVTLLFEKIITAVSIIVVEMDVEIPNVTLFAANLLFLWNISFLYMVMMLIAYGWCISKVIISPSEKQLVVLIGAGMMLVEVLLVGDVEIYSMSLLLSYIVVFRVFHAQSTKAVRFLNSQIDNLSNLGENFSVLKIALQKKKELLGDTLILLSLYLTGRVTVNIARMLIAPFYTTSVQEFFQACFVGFLLYLFRLRIPEEARLRILPDGHVAIIPSISLAENIDSTSRLEMSPTANANNIQKLDESFIVIQPCIRETPIIDLAVLHV